jgi:hypothetical protein
MSNRSIKVALAGAGLLVSSVAANAGITLSGISKQTGPVAGPGSYRVSVYASKVGAQYAFRVYNTSANWVAGKKPTTDVDVVRLQFFTGNVNAAHTSCAGAVVGGVTISGTASTFATKPGGTGGAFTTAGGTFGRFTNGGGTLSVRETRELNKLNNNMFAQSASGRIMVALTAKCFTVQLTNFNAEAGETFTTYDALAFQVPTFGVPEGSSAALMLPGILTVGLALRRRRSNRSSGKAA